MNTTQPAVCVICHNPNPTTDRTCSRTCEIDLAFALGRITDYPDDIEENTGMNTYEITYTYSGDIVEEIKAASIKDAIAMVEPYGHKYTVTTCGGVEIDLRPAGNPRVTLKRPRKSS